MKTIMRKKLITLFLCGVFLITEMMFPLRTNAAEEGTDPEQEWDWLYEYTGNEQVFKAPYSGIYEFVLYGAQGGDAYENEGGKGGKITASVALSRGEEVMIYVGGKDGYNGGGNGTVSNGGGATDIRVNGREIADRILVAGGGGANKIYQGGNGGVTATAGILGAGANSTEGAGGGGGYLGGNAGSEHIVEHVHIGDSKNGGECYSPVYHKHTGNSTNGGGCYGEAVRQYHSHVDGCYPQKTTPACYWGQITYPASTIEGVATGDYWRCTCSCGAVAEGSVAGGISVVPGSMHKAETTTADRTKDPICGKTENTVESTTYRLNCGMTTNTITGYELSCSKTYDGYDVKQATGGTNYYDADSCIAAVSAEGIQTGDGECSIKLLTLYNLYYDGTESLNVYYDGIKVKKVYFKGKLIYRE